MGVISSITNNLFLEQSEIFHSVYKNATKTDTETFNSVSINSIDNWYNSILTKNDFIDGNQLQGLHAFFNALKSVLSQIDPNKLEITNEVVEDSDLMLWRESSNGISKLIFDEFGQIVYLFNGNNGDKIKGVFDYNVDIEKLLYRFISKWSFRNLECSLEYIPSHLHTNNLPVIGEFYIGEELYYRCKSGECAKPYDKISLYDISHNRNFNDSKKYLKTDVLFNTIETDPRHVYENLDVTILKIQTLEDGITYFKEIISQDNPDLTATIKLIHTPLPCMYPHCSFELSINGVIVNPANYGVILNKKNRAFKNLRSDIRQELTSIIQTGKIDSSKETEYLDEP